MRRVVFLLILAIAVVIVWGAVFVLARPDEQTIAPLPTLYVLPSATATSTPTSTLTPVPTATHTPTALPTPTSTLTDQPTSTATLATRVMALRAIMPGVDLPATPTPFPQGTILLPAPPDPVEPLPDATHEPPPYSGWYSFESDHPLVEYSKPWLARQIIDASQGQYHRTDDSSSDVTFPFTGEGLRIRYVAAPNMGLFDVIVDGQLIDTVDAFADTLHFPGTQVYFVGPGSHVLTLRSIGEKNAASDGYVVGLDAIQVFRGTANTLIIPPPTPSATPIRRMAEVALIAAPPPLEPTPTPAAPEPVQVSLVIAYDENGNGAVDPAEGVAGISVRVVAVGDNQPLAQAFTDAQGYVQIAVSAADATRLVVPYFGEVWDLSRAGRGELRFTLLLEPGNQPGLIP